MTNRLHDALSDLVEEVPEHVVRDDLADRSWVAGRRRRWRRRGAVAGAALAVLAVVGQGIQPAADWMRTVQPAASRGSDAADGYPQRIGHQWWLRDLPDRPGPMAGIFVRSSEAPGSRETWVAVSETGKQWRIPIKGSSGGMAPTLSSTGRYLGYFRNPHRPPYVVHDLVTGEKTVLRDVWPHVAPGPSPMIHMQTPAFWASDDNGVLLYTIDPGATKLLLSPTGEMKGVRAGRYPAGWIGADRLAFLSDDERDRGGVTGARITVVDTSGVEQKKVELDLPRSFGERSSYLSQWSAVVSPDGRFVAVLLEGPRDAVYRFSLDDGRLVSGPTDVDGAGGLCPLGWRGDRAIVPTYPDQANGALAELAGSSLQPMVVADPSVDAQCLTLAASAANGTPHGLLGTSTSWFSWWWKEMVLAGIALVLLGVAWRRYAGWSRRFWGASD